MNKSNQKSLCLALGLATLITGAQAFDVEGVMTPGHTITKAIFMYQITGFSEWHGWVMEDSLGFHQVFPAGQSTTFYATLLNEPHQFAVFGVFDVDHVTVAFDPDFAPYATGHSYEEQFPGWTEPDSVNWISNNDYASLSTICQEFYPQFAEFAGPGATLVSYSDGVLDGSVTVEAVPEPASLAVMGLGIAALLRRRSRIRHS